MKTGVLLWALLESIGLDEQAIKVIMVFYFIAILIFLIGLIASIFNTAQYTKKITEQNKQIIKELQMIRIATVEQTNIKYKEIEEKYEEYQQQ